MSASYKQKILERMARAMKDREQIEWPPGSGHKLPPGEFPIAFFQGPEYGGSAANVRLSELRMPEEELKQYSGIPIRKNVVRYTHNGEEKRIVTYRLGISQPKFIDLFIDFDKCRLRKDVIADYGGIIEEYDDDARDSEGRSHDKPGKAVRIVTREIIREREQREAARRPPHPLAPQLPVS